MEKIREEGERKRKKFSFKSIIYRKMSGTDSECLKLYARDIEDFGDSSLELQV